MQLFKIGYILTHIFVFLVFFIPGCAMSGLVADSRTMIDRARVEAQVCSFGLIPNLETNFMFSYLTFCFLNIRSYCGERNYARGSSKRARICLGRSNSHPPACESCLTSGLPTSWRTCKLPHRAIEPDVAFWYDYLSPAWMHLGQRRSESWQHDKRRA